MKINLERGETPRAIYHLDFSKTRPVEPSTKPDFPKSMTVIQPDGSVHCFEHAVVFEGEKVSLRRKKLKP